MTRPADPARTHARGDRDLAQGAPALPQSDAATAAGAPALTLGAYALAPPPEHDSDADEAALYAALATAGVSAVELPLGVPGSRGSTPGWVLGTLPPAWDVLVTCVPRTMARLATDPTYGLSSTDPAGRQAALDDLAEVRDLAHALADASGRRRVTAIEVHSAPGPVRGSLGAFRESLETLLGWDLCGADLLVEHCDALVPGQQPVKGFWTLTDEIAVIRSIEPEEADPTQADAGRLGVSVNWGRSAIEGRSAATATEHVRTAARAGLLRALMFSGATGVETAWGDAWFDAHIPPRGDDPALAASSASALGAEEVAASLAAAAGSRLRHLGAKVTVRPLDAGPAERAAVARATLDLVASQVRAAGLVATGVAPSAAAGGRIVG